MWLFTLPQLCIYYRSIMLQRTPKIDTLRGLRYYWYLHWQPARASRFTFCDHFCALVAQWHQNGRQKRYPDVQLQPLQPSCIPPYMRAIDRDSSHGTLSCLLLASVSWPLKLTLCDIQIWKTLHNIEATLSSEQSVNDYGKIRFI